MTAPTLTLACGDAVYEIVLDGPDRNGTIRLSGRRSDGPSEPIALAEFSARTLAGDGEFVFCAGGTRLRCFVAREGRGVWVGLRGRAAYLQPVASAGSRAGTSRRISQDEVRAPMTGVIAEVRVAPGTRVTRGDVVAVMEAMKMEYRLTAPRDGQVETVACAAGDRVEVAAVILRLSPNEEIGRAQERDARHP
jgi:acetyl/propionyl-CoA carboxylase alpha subunit